MQVVADKVEEREKRKETDNEIATLKALVESLQKELATTKQSSGSEVQKLPPEISQPFTSEPKQIRK